MNDKQVERFLGLLSGIEKSLIAIWLTLLGGIILWLFSVMG